MRLPIFLFVSFVIIGVHFAFANSLSCDDPRVNCDTAPSTKLEVSTLSDNAHKVQAHNPRQLVRLGANKFRKWAGCGFSINWGDGAYSPTGPIDADCNENLKHVYKNSGSYKVKAEIWHPGPDDAPVTDWAGETTVTID